MLNEVRLDRYAPPCAASFWRGRGRISTNGAPPGPGRCSPRVGRLVGEVPTQPTSSRAVPGAARTCVLHRDPASPTYSSMSTAWILISARSTTAGTMMAGRGWAYRRTTHGDALSFVPTSTPWGWWRTARRPACQTLSAGPAAPLDAGAGRPSAAEQVVMKALSRIRAIASVQFPDMSAALPGSTRRLAGLRPSAQPDGRSPWSSASRSRPPWLFWLWPSFWVAPPPTDGAGHVVVVVSRTRPASRCSTARQVLRGAGAVAISEDVSRRPWWTRCA